MAGEKCVAISDAATADRATAASQLASFKQRSKQERAQQDEVLRAAETAAGSHAQQAQSLRMQLKQHTLESEAVKRLAQDKQAALQRELSQARQDAEDAEDAVTSGTAAAAQLRLQHAESEAALQQHAASAIAAAESRLAERCAAGLRCVLHGIALFASFGEVAPVSTMHVSCAGMQALSRSNRSGSLGQVLCVLPLHRACSTCSRTLMLHRQPSPPCLAV